MQSPTCVAYHRKALPLTQFYKGKPLCTVNHDGSGGQQSTVGGAQWGGTLATPPSLIISDGHNKTHSEILQ
ncbi:hypothetical protein RRG08_042152 [Elysia crispata]|uniref:Uncharacterized protein n=1 Tax=Elysia crispata TaxID=231223 RepID=A0AAE1DBZ7_9GAST|nr:hypothetical protein RRG08_042152 [Elysia crispata]